jgi:hypothetical protein
MTNLSSFVTVSVAACVLSASAPLPISSEAAAIVPSTNVVLCVGKSQCDAYWQRAQAWVANNSEYRLQTVTDTVIETQGPTLARSALAFRVTRVPDNEDGARIYVLAACGNSFGCKPAAPDAVVAFKHFVTS